MEEVSNDEVYGVKRIKQKLQRKYEENIFFAEVSGNKNVIFRNMADRIVSDQWYDNKRQNADNEAKRIIETAPKIIKNEPTCVRAFMDELFLKSATLNGAQELSTILLCLGQGWPSNQQNQGVWC